MQILFRKMYSKIINITTYCKLYLCHTIKHMQVMDILLADRDFSNFLLTLQYILTQVLQDKIKSKICTKDKL